MEVMVALGLLSIAVVLLSQMAVGQFTERRRQAARLEALEAAANILETARSLSPEALTPEWAAAQRLPAGFDDRVRDPKLAISMEPYPAQKQLKRVKVRITWVQDPRLPVEAVELTGYFGVRQSSPSGSKP